MSDLALESILAVVLIGLWVYLWRVGGTRKDLSQQGWRLILGGFGLLLFASLVDVTDNFPSLNRYVVVGDTEVQACIQTRVTYEFPARGDLVPVNLHWYDGGMKPPRPRQLEYGRQWGTNGALYVGEKGKIFGGRLIPESRQLEYGTPPRKLERSPGHHMEWILACKGGSPAGSNFPDHAGLLAQVVLLGNVALQPALKEKIVGTKLQWDPQAFKITNMPEANQYLHREYRAGWTL